MIGVTFDNLHSFNDFGLYLSCKAIGGPEAKIETIDIPNSDGVLDFTDFYGDTKYRNRTLTFTFTAVGSDLIVAHSNFKNYVHGQKMKITLDEDCDFYYVGRISVGDYSIDRKILKFDVVCDCEPFKLKNKPTVVSFSNISNNIVYLKNLRKRAIPKISISTTPRNGVLVTYWNNSISNTAILYNGDNQIISDLILEGGTNRISIISSTDTCDIKFEYQEGGF